jgi:hypothetical protein
MTMVGSGIAADGKPAKVRTVTTWMDKDTLDFTMHMENPAGKEQEVLKIAYKRKKP